MGFITGKSPADLARSAGRITIIFALAILFGSSYGGIGFGLGTFITFFDTPEWVFDTWLLAWVAAGSVAITVWAVRWTGIGASGGAR